MGGEARRVAGFLMWAGPVGVFVESVGSRAPFWFWKRSGGERTARVLRVEVVNV
jgi:hypothetical protein